MVVVDGFHQVAIYRSATFESQRSSVSVVLLLRFFFLTHKCGKEFSRGRTKLCHVFAES